MDPNYGRNLWSSYNHTSTMMYDSFELLIQAAVEQNKDHFKSCTDYILCCWKYLLYKETGQ